MSTDSQHQDPPKAKEEPPSTSPVNNLPHSVLIIERRERENWEEEDWELDWLTPPEIGGDLGDLEDDNVILPIFTTKKQAIEFTALQRSRWAHLSFRWREISATFTPKETSKS